MVVEDAIQERVKRMLAGSRPVNKGPCDEIETGPGVTSESVEGVPAVAVNPIEAEILGVPSSAGVEVYAGLLPDRGNLSETKLGVKKQARALVEEDQEPAEEEESGDDDDGDELSEVQMRALACLDEEDVEAAIDLYVREAVEKVRRSVEVDQ